MPMAKHSSPLKQSLLSPYPPHVCFGRTKVQSKDVVLTKGE